MTRIYTRYSVAKQLRIICKFSFTIFKPPSSIDDCSLKSAFKTTCASRWLSLYNLSQIWPICVQTTLKPWIFPSFRHSSTILPLYSYRTIPCNLCELVTPPLTLRSFAFPGKGTFARNDDLYVASLHQLKSSSPINLKKVVYKLTVRLEQNILYFFKAVACKFGTLGSFLNISIVRSRVVTVDMTSN